VLRGMDISAYQGPEDIAGMVSGYRLDFVICRALQSDYALDPRFPEYWAALGRTTAVRGAYNFANTGFAPAAEADRFIDYVQANGMVPTDLLVLDLESSGGLTATALAAWAIAWARRLKARLPGYTPLLYGPYPTHPQYAELPRHFAAWWWPYYPAVWSQRAAWPGSLPAVPANYWPGGPTIWQFSQDFPVGPNDPHDANVSTLTLDQLRSLNPGAQDMAFTQADAITLLSTPLQQFVPEQTLNIDDKVTVGSALAMVAYALGGAPAKDKVTLGQLLAASTRPAPTVDVPALAAALAPLLPAPPGSVPLAEVEAALRKVLGGTGITATFTPSA
jgi:lysozyme